MRNYDTVYEKEDFSYREFKNYVFKNVDFNNVSFISANFKHTVFNNCCFRNCDFSHADLTGTRFHECIIHNCSFHKTNLHSCIGLIHGEFNAITIEPYLSTNGVLFWTPEALGNKKFIVEYYENILLEEYLGELEDHLKQIIITGRK